MNLEKGFNMELKLREGYVDIDGIHIQISKLSQVSTIRISVKNSYVSFLCADVGKYIFMYDDTLKFSKLKQEIAGNPTETGICLRCLKNDYNAEHELWVQLCYQVVKDFNLNRYTFAHDCGISCTSNYFNYEPSKRSFVKKISDTQKAFDLLNSVLPKNISLTRTAQFREEAEQLVSEFANICGSSLENKEAYRVHIESLNGDNVEKWEACRRQFKSIFNRLHDYTSEGLIDEYQREKIKEILHHCIDYSVDRIANLREEFLVQEYGSVDDLKKRLRNNINKLKFTELLELFKEYKERESVLCAKTRQLKLDTNELPIIRYIDVYRLGSVLISDRMNQLNKNKVKNKHIPQELLDEALVFYYDSTSAAEAHTVRANEKYAQDKESGDRGEQKVDYALRWLDKSYVQLEQRSKDRIGNKCICILNSDFIDEKQEFDHLIVSPKGIFSIETKNYSGKLTIDSYGNWLRVKSDGEEGLRNPIQQIRQHEKVLKSFIPDYCNIISVICIANDRAIIEGIENSIIPIVKSDLLVEFIENWESDSVPLTTSQMDQVIMEIYSHMI